jgi:hypothetical protein
MRNSLAMRISTVGALFVIGSTGALFAQQRPLRFQGEVMRGGTFRKEIGRGLVLVLKPDDEGWTVAVEPAVKAGVNQGAACEMDYAAVVAVPMRGYREVDLSATYGNTAQEAVALSPREIDFVLSADDCKREAERRTKLMWSYSYSAKEVQDAEAKFATSPEGKIVLKVIDSKVSAAGVLVEGKDPGKIDWLKFEVVVTFPVKATPKR